MRRMLMFILCIGFLFTSSTTFAALACPNYAVFTEAEKTDYNKYIQSIQCRVMNAVGRNYDFNRYSADNACIQSCHDQKPERAKVSPFNYSTYYDNWVKFETCVITTCKAAVAKANEAARVAGTAGAAGTSASGTVNLSGTTSLIGGSTTSSASGNSGSNTNKTGSNTSGAANTGADNTATTMQMLQLMAGMGGNKGSSAAVKDADDSIIRSTGSETRDGSSVTNGVASDSSNAQKTLSQTNDTAGTAMAGTDVSTNNTDLPSGMDLAADSVQAPETFSFNLGDGKGDFTFDYLGGTMQTPTGSLITGPDGITNFDFFPENAYNSYLIQLDEPLKKALGGADLSNPPAPPAETMALADQEIAEDKTYDNQLQQEIQTAEAEVDGIWAKCKGVCAARASASMGFDSTACYNACHVTRNSGIAQIKKLQAAAASYIPSQNTCTASAVKADNLCSYTRNPNLQKIQMIMTLGTTLMSSTSSASKTCKRTANLSKISQMAMLAGSLACTGVKMMCDSACLTASNSLNSMTKEAQALATHAPNSSGKIVRLITQEQTQNNKPRIAQCKKHALDIAQFATQALGLAVAAKQAKSCEVALCQGSNCSDDGKKGTDPKVDPITTTEYCSLAKNASEFICVCMKSPDAAGCPGAIVKNDTTDPNNPNNTTTTKTNNPNIVKTTSNTNGMANGINPYKQSTNLSKAARTALGLDGNSPNGSNLTAGTSTSGATDAAAGDSANGLGGSSGGGSRGGLLGSLSGSSSENGNGSDKAKNGNIGDGALGAAGGYGGNDGGGSGGRNGANGGKDYTEKQKADLKRKIASDQFRAEVTTSTGKSNWEKVKTRYTENRSTLLGQ